MAKTKYQHQFKVVIERDQDGYFVASVPALPGCHAQAKTLPQLMERIRDAIKLCRDVAKNNSRYQRRIKQFAYEPTFLGMEMITL